MGARRTLRRNYQLIDYERVCRYLGIESTYTRSPQAKERIELQNQTLQGRWPNQLAYEVVIDIEQPNADIDRFIDHYNEEFSVLARGRQILMFLWLNLVSIYIESVPVGVKRTYRFLRTENVLSC